MFRKVLLFTFFILSTPTYAGLNECIGVYVGRISIANQGLNKVVFIKRTSDTSGSYWVNFSGWTSEAKKEALSILIAAKAAQHRVDVYTTGVDACDIGNGGRTLKEIHLSTNK